MAGLEIDQSVVFGILRNFEGALGNGSVFEQKLGAVELDLRQLFVLDGLAVVGISAGDVRAPHFEQKLALLHFVAQPRVDFHDPARGERRHRHLPRDIRTDDAGYVQFRRGNVLARGGQRKLLRVIHLEIVGVQVRHHGRSNRADAGQRASLRRDFPLAAGGEKAQAHAERLLRRDDQAIHCDNLPARGHVHLGRGSQVRTNQIQIRQSSVPIGFLRIQEIQQRCAAVLEGKRHPVANIGRQRQIFGLIRPKKIQGLDQRPVGGIHVAEDLGLGGVPQSFVAADVESGSALSRPDSGRRCADGMLTLPPTVSLANGLLNEGLCENQTLKVGSVEPLATASW